MTSQRAREAAEDAYLTCFEDVPNPAWMDALIAGKHDNDPVVQAFARIEAEALARGRLEGAKAMQEAHPFARLRQVIYDDLEYAWAWQCNLAVPILDTIPCTHAHANEAAALIMAQMFGYDITKHPEYTAGKSPAQEYFEMRVEAEKEEDLTAIVKGLNDASD